MSQKRLKTWQKATALVPLALLSGAWTTSLAVTGTASAATKDATSLPDGTTIPDQAIEAPASLSRPGEIALGVPAGAASSVISSASTNGIPAAALAAYQRAAQVINSADAGCNISWQLIAAIGRVESDHGRYGGNVLDENGRSTPGIFGIPLDGSNGTARITDTDAAQYDDDPVYDRAVGPMQFIPSTWSVVGVDGDGDDVRDPQDIDDAALASAVYLCSGEEDLSTTAGQRSSVYRYNHSSEYVDLVLSIMNAYLVGDYASVPSGAAAPTVFAPMSATPEGQKADAGKRGDGKKDGPGSQQADDQGPRSAGPGGGSTGGNGGSTGGTGGDDGGDDSSTAPDGPDVPGTEPSQDPTKPVKDAVGDATKDVEDTVEDTVTPVEEATAFCQTNLSSAELQAVGGLDACVAAYLDGGAGAVQGLLDSVDDVVGGLLD